MGDISVTITVEAPVSRREAGLAAMDGAFDEARRIENAVSEWRPDSDATQLNQNAGKALVPVGKDMQAILLKAAEVSGITDGAFDITFTSKNKRATYRDVIVIPELGLAYLRPGVAIGVSGIAKGYIVDRMSGVLRKAGFRKFLVNAGDLYAAGGWEIGVRNPRDKDGPPLCRLTVRDRAVSTSGLYERGPHIVDPRSRRPSRKIASLTVVARDAVLSDALATGLLVLGNRSWERMERAAGVLGKDADVLAVTPQGTVLSVGAVSAGAVSARVVSGGGCR